MPDDPLARLGNTHRRMQEELRALDITAQSGNRQALDLGLEFFATAAVRHHEDEEASRPGDARREIEVLALLPLGLSNAEIGRRLFISPKAVEHHVGHILDKLGLETRAAAAAHVAKARPGGPGTQ